MMKKLRKYKEANFNSWLELIMTLGIVKLEEGGFLIMIYFWGGGLSLLGMWLMLKFSSV